MPLRKLAELPIRPTLHAKWLRLRLPERVLYCGRYLCGAVVPVQLRHRRSDLRAVRSAAVRPMPEWKLLVRGRSPLRADPTVQQRPVQVAKLGRCASGPFSSKPPEAGT